MTRAARRNLPERERHKPDMDDVHGTRRSALDASRQAGFAEFLRRATRCRAGSRAGARMTATSA
jgi:hypothetical protein